MKMEGIYLVNINKIRLIAFIFIHHFDIIFNIIT